MKSEEMLNGHLDSQQFEMLSQSIVEAYQRNNRTAPAGSETVERRCERGKVLWRFYRSSARQSAEIESALFSLVSFTIPPFSIPLLFPSLLLVRVLSLPP